MKNYAIITPVQFEANKDKGIFYGDNVKPVVLKDGNYLVTLKKGKSIGTVMDKKATREFLDTELK